MCDRNVVVLLWSLPVALSLHVFEEFAFPGGLKQWIKDYKPRKPRSDFYYFIVNAAAIVGAVVIALKASGPVGFCVYLNSIAIMGGNAASHIRGTFQKKQYCPGSLSGACLLLPLLVISYWYFLGTGKVNLPSAIICFCLGFIVGFYVFGVDIRRADPA